MFHLCRVQAAGHHWWFATHELNGYVFGLRSRISDPGIRDGHRSGAVLSVPDVLENERSPVGYTSLFRFLLAGLVQLLAPYLNLLLICAVLLGIFSSTHILESVLGSVGRGLRDFLGMAIRAVLGGLRAYFPWSIRTARRWALTALRGRAGHNPRRWQVDLLGFALSLVIWGATSCFLFYPWIPVSWMSTAPAGPPTVPPAAPPAAPPGGPPAASASERLARHLSQTLDRAHRKGMGGIEVSARGYSDADIDSVVDLLGDPAKAAAAGLSPLDVSRSDRLRGFLRVTPPGGATGPIQDFP